MLNNKNALITGLCFICGVVALILGSWAHYQYGAETLGKAGNEDARAYNAIVASVMMFVFSFDTDKDVNCWIDVSRVLAIGSLWGGIAFAILQRQKKSIAAWRARFWCDHIVIIGLGERGLAFAESAFAEKAGALSLQDRQRFSNKVLVIDAQPDPSAESRLAALGAVVVAGDARSKSLLKLYRVYNAAVVVVVTADDESNISTINALAAVIRGAKVKKRFSLESLLQWVIGSSIREKLKMLKSDLQRAVQWSKQLFGNKKNAEDPRDKEMGRCAVYVQIDNDEVRSAARENYRRMQLKPQDDESDTQQGGDKKNKAKHGVVSLSDRKKFVFDSFSGRDLVASSWHKDAKLHSLAALRGERQLHLLVAGIDDMTLEIIRVFVQLAPAPGFGTPVLSLLLNDLSKSESGEAESAQLSRLKAQFPQLDNISLTLKLHSWKGMQEAVSEELLIAVERACPVSAIVVSDSDDRVSSTLALRLRQASRQVDYWRAPIYLHLRHQAGFQYAIRNAADTKRLSDVLEPFGSIESCCTLDYLVDGREELARKIHANYTKWEKIKGQNATGTDNSFDSLEDTYKSANRRQAEHIPVKLSCLGYESVADNADYLCARGVQFEVTELLDKLAEAEHDSWFNERLLDGWASSSSRERDNKRKLHNTLISYDELRDEQDKKGVLYTEYDKDAVRFVSAIRSDSGGSSAGESVGLWQESDEPTWRRVVDIALIGKRKISKAEVQIIRSEMPSKIRTLVAANPGCMLRFITPLAPGSDLVMAKVVIAEAEKYSNVDLSLVILEAVPREAMLDDNEDLFDGNEFYPCDDPRWDRKRDWDAELVEKDTPQDKPIGKANLAKLIEDEVEQNKITDWVLEISERGKLPGHWKSREAKDEGYARAAEWMIKNCDWMVACTRSRNPDGRLDNAKAKGGTSWTIARWPQAKSAKVDVDEASQTKPSDEKTMDCIEHKLLQIDLSECAAKITCK